MSDNEFLDQEAQAIILELTGKPFGIKDNLWLYWLFRLELIPGGWDATFYLEENDSGKSEHSFSSFGSPSQAVKNAYAQIDREWLDKGFERGAILDERYKKASKKESKKNEYWRHFLDNDQYWGYGFTKLRLGKIREIIWKDENFWSDVLERHDGWNRTPEEMRDGDLAVYEHCMGNMTGMMAVVMRDKKVSKRWKK